MYNLSEINYVQFCIANPGKGFNLLKPGVKRPRNRASKELEINEMALKAQVDEESKNRILNLEKALLEKEELVKSNENAATILSGFISKGKAKFNEQGEVVLIDQDSMSNYVELERDLNI